MASPISFLKVLFYILRVSPMLISFIDRKGFFRRVGVNLSPWRWHNRMLTAKGVLEALQSCKLAKTDFLANRHEFQPITRRQNTPNHIPSFKGELFQPHFNLVAIWLSKRGNAFFLFILTPPPKSYFRTPWNIYAWVCHSLKTGAGAWLLQHWTKASVTTTEKRSVISGTNPIFDSTDFGPLYFQGR